MPPPDVLYCAQQIHIPSDLPNILKQFTKAAIRTQPQDMLVWSIAYFSALAKGKPLPVKDRLEMNVATQKTDTGLTPGLLKVLHKQLSSGETCSTEDLEMKWKGLCLPADQLKNLLALGQFGSDVDWMQFFALGCTALGGCINSALKLACEILTEDKEGGPARIPFSTFSTLYSYLALLDGDVPDVDRFLRSLQEKVDRQGGMVKPLDFLDKGPPGDQNFTASSMAQGR